MLSVLAVEDLMIQGYSTAIPLLLWWHKCVNVTTHPDLGTKFGES